MGIPFAYRAARFAAPLVAGYLGGKGINAMKRMGSFSAGQVVKRSRGAFSGGSGGSNPGGRTVTQYNQTSTTYRKRGRRRGRRANRGRRRARRFKRGVNRIIDNRLGDTVLLRNFDVSVSGTPTGYSDGQKWFNWTMLGFETGGNVAVGDIGPIMTNALSQGANTSKSIVVKSWVMDFSILNNGANGVYVDIYYYRPKVANASPADLLIDDGLNKTLTGGLGTHVTNRNYFGVTPFMSPEFCRTYTILKMKRLVLSPDQQYNEIIKRKGDKKLMGAYVNGLNGSEPYGFYPHLTEGILISVFGVGVGSPSLPDPFSVQVQCTKTYNTCYIDFAQNANGFSN